MGEAWARSGAMWVTGRADGPPLQAAGDPAGAVEDALAALGAPGGPDVRLLGERAALLGLARRGSTSAGGACRLLPSADGWVAVSLPRDSDVELLPALVEGPVDDPWADLARWAARVPGAAIAERAALLGLPAARVPGPGEPARRPGVLVTGGGGRRRSGGRPRVLDLSSLWAGPLCAHLLGLLGADVVKVESTRRPDGARGGEPAFFDLLHAGQRSVALDLETDDGRVAVRALVARADLVIEASRPRALRRLGILAEDAVAAGTSWLSITAYGRDEADALRPGFGDDVAAGAGLLAWDARGPVFAGDALADPLTGVTAAAAAHDALDRADAVLLDVSMHDVARAAALLPSTPGGEAAPPTARVPTGRAPELGADTRSVLEGDWPLRER